MPTAPYDVLNTVLNTARVRLNDALQSLGGDTITNAQPFTQQMANDGWRRLQELLANLGVTRLKREVILTGLPVVASVDPAAQTYLNWTNFFDGVNLTASLVLPQDLILPLKLWERPTGQNASFGLPMENQLDGLPTWPKTFTNGCWEWREDSIFLPGSLASMDLRIRYAAYLADFATVGSVQWYNQPVPIMRALNPLADYICAEAAAARGDLDAGAFTAAAEAGAKLIVNREVAMKQRVNVRRIPRSRSARRGCDFW